jgi:hypothetical protein
MIGRLAPEVGDKEGDLAAVAAARRAGINQVAGMAELIRLLFQARPEVGAVRRISGTNRGRVS